MSQTPSIGDRRTSLEPHHLVTQRSTESKALQWGGEGANSNLSIYVALDFTPLNFVDLKKDFF